MKSLERRRNVVSDGVLDICHHRAGPPPNRASGQPEFWLLDNFLPTALTFRGETHGEGRGKIAGHVSTLHPLYCGGPGVTATVPPNPA